jgi:hypothetical protein
VIARQAGDELEPIALMLAHGVSPLLSRRLHSEAETCDAAFALVLREERKDRIWLALANRRAAVISSP